VDEEWATGEKKFLNERYHNDQGEKGNLMR
jgi:hypothetical protein